MKTSTKLLVLSLIFINLLVVLVYVHFKTITNDLVAKYHPQTEFQPSNIPLLDKTSTQLRTPSIVQSRHSRPLYNISWSDFLSIQPPTLTKRNHNKQFEKYDLNICPSSIVDALNKPELSLESIQWCQWALSPTGGKVQVGKSYGSLQKKERDKYEQMNCNAVAKGINPSCDMAWGDGQITSWKNRSSGDVCGNNKRNHDSMSSSSRNKDTTSTTTTSGTSSTSQIQTKKYGSNIKCFDSQSEARFCVFENVLLDFSKMHDKKRDRSTDTRSWDKGFLASDCDDEKYPTLDRFFPFYSSSIDIDDTICNMIYTEPVLQMSHDDIDNLGHSLSDFMNVWAMLWLSGYGDRSQEISFLNIDAIRQGHNYYDKINQFFSHYQKKFKQILQASRFPKNSKICFKTLIFQPNPVLLFTWDGWWEDRVCSFIGPSSLFQRWNLQIRQCYDLLKIKNTLITTTDTGTIIPPSSSQIVNNNNNHHSNNSSNNSNTSSNKWRILVILRKLIPHDGSSKYASRIFSNSEEIITALKTLPHPSSSSSRSLGTNTDNTYKKSHHQDEEEEDKVEVMAVDLASLSFTDQVKLIASVSIVIGMHGAGMATTMHMAVGSNSGTNDDNDSKMIDKRNSNKSRYNDKLRSSSSTSATATSTSTSSSASASGSSTVSLKCCGVIEIFPAGEFTPIRGYGNMARRMGHAYSRLDVGSGGGGRTGGGTKVNVKELMIKVKEMMISIDEKPSCVLPSVIHNPYFINTE